MNEEKRVEEFLSCFREINKLLFKIKSEAVSQFGLKSIHVMCLFYLSTKGPMSSSALVRLTLEDKAAISKAMVLLKEKGFVEFKKGYNEKIFLTDRGKEISEEVKKECYEVLKVARKDISDQDAFIFTKSLNLILKNLKDYSEKGK